MTRDEAHSFLNAAQQGMKATRQEITRALYATGDLGCMPESLVEQRVAAHSYPFYATETGQPA